MEEEDDPPLPSAYGSLSFLDDDNVFNVWPRGSNVGGGQPVRERVMPDENQTTSEPVVEQQPAEQQPDEQQAAEPQPAEQPAAEPAVEPSTEPTAEASAVTASDIKVAPSNN